mmetsp:Transcript_14339/g.38692  ORF Transcript_14339/g.38692 Transcript_14339/m.38692 type:complete len:206 (+) Transcript_14339:974-1591(+)
MAMHSVPLSTAHHGWVGCSRPGLLTTVLHGQVGDLGTRTCAQDVRRHCCVLPALAWIHSMPYVNGLGASCMAQHGTHAIAHLCTMTVWPCRRLRQHHEISSALVGHLRRDARCQAAMAANRVDPAMPLMFHGAHVLSDGRGIIAGGDDACSGPRRGPSAACGGSRRCDYGHYADGNAPSVCDIWRHTASSYSPRCAATSCNAPRI